MNKDALKVIYLDNNLIPGPGWYWTLRAGNRVIYTGPFQHQETAEKDLRRSQKNFLATRQAERNP